MNQEFETQLQVVQRALGEVVLPALGGAEGHVIEQLHLSIAALAFMQQRLSRSRHFHRETVSSYVAMAEAIIALLSGYAGAESGGLAVLVTEGRSLLQAPAADDAHYIGFTRQLRARIAAVAADAPESAYEGALDALILDLSGPILLRDRVWCIPLGFELRPEDLPDIEKDQVG
ncbi:hypothetical protein [Novosphingobium lentum]|uniref:hypothetical protein n=1 Tax=Novosphingobium lentum TaxID=145287 RepID=UPI000831BB57|nr:hypothetical protein [Novosphingobium lentum]